MLHDSILCGCTTNYLLCKTYIRNFEWNHFYHAVSHTGKKLEQHGMSKCSLGPACRPSDCSFLKNMGTSGSEGRYTSMSRGGRTPPWLLPCCPLFATLCWQQGTLNYVSSGSRHISASQLVAVFSAARDRSQHHPPGRPVVFKPLTEQTFSPLYVISSVLADILTIGVLWMNIQTSLHENIVQDLVSF